MLMASSVYKLVVSNNGSKYGNERNRDFCMQVEMNNGEKGGYGMHTYILAIISGFMWLKHAKADKCSYMSSN